MGDFNCKIGDRIEGNKLEVTKAGKLLLQLMDREELEVVNNSEQCKGKWTRVEKLNKSILDYIIIRKDDITKIKEAIIDEEKIMAPAKIMSEEGQTRTVFSDHNVIICKFRWTGYEGGMKRVEKEKIMTAQGYRKFEKLVRKEKISDIWDKEGDISQLYEE